MSITENIGIGLIKERRNMRKWNELSVAEKAEMMKAAIRNGIYNLEGKVNNDDCVIIHDGIRPLVDGEVLTDVINKCKKYGNAVTSMSYTEQIFKVAEDDDTTTIEYIPRETIRRVSTPQAYRFDLLFTKYHEAFEKNIGIEGSNYANTMMVQLGVRLHFAAGSDKNIKITTKDDLELFKSYLKSTRNDWLK
jgi:2-C-methyl-D-erythritol 4-phosphate cytidylyltransferase